MVTCPLTSAVVITVTRLLLVDGASVKAVGVDQLVAIPLLLLLAVMSPRRVAGSDLVKKVVVQEATYLLVAAEPLKMAPGREIHSLRLNLLVMASTGLVLSGEVDSKCLITITVEHMSMTSMSSS